MNPYYDQIIEAAFLHSRQNCYFVGPYARRVSFASQQHRALDLVTALEMKGHLGGKRIAIIGAGVAGVTAAAALRGLGYGLDLYETEEEPMTLQRGAEHRVIHPSISRWPAEDLELTTKFRVLDWSAGPCSNVIATLRDQWNQYIKPVPTDTGYRFIPKRKITSLLCFKGEVTFEFDSDSDSPAPKYDIVLVTTGFGHELEVAGAPRVSYWTPDKVDMWRRSRAKVIVSGCGDGGLIDALRLVHGHFNDGRLALEVAHTIDNHGDGTKELIAQAEDKALLAAKSIKCISTPKKKAQSDRQVGKAFEDESVVGPLSDLYELLASKLPPAVETLLSQSYEAARCARGQVTLVSLQSRPFGPYAAPIHKLMVAHAMSNFFITYKCLELKRGGKLAGIDGKRRDIIVRHGAHSNLESLLEPEERESLRIRQFLLADYIEKKDKYTFPVPPRVPSEAFMPSYIASKYRMANELVGWMKKGVTLTAKEDGFYLDEGDTLADCGLGAPTQLFGIPLLQGSPSAARFF